jgi:hypothetical protein
MAPTTRAARLAALVDQEREAQAAVPTLPPEVWLLIFLQNTNPKHLWNVGRQVCSMWRSEIPKVIARKYLEDPDLTQIHCDCETAYEQNLTCLMGSKLIFSHYEENKLRAVFKKCPEDKEDDHCWMCSHYLAVARREKSRDLDDFYMGRDVGDGMCLDCEGVTRGQRCDIPPYIIRIKWEAHDTELPNLEADFEKGEISFEWQGMLETFFRETAILDRFDDEIATESLQWLSREKPSMVKVIVRAREDQELRWLHKKEVRRNRIDRRDNEIHRQCTGDIDSDVEHMILQAAHQLESPKGAYREDEEEKEIKEYQRVAERKLADVDRVDARFPPGNEERALSKLWREQMVDVPREMRRGFEALYAVQWLGRQRM